MARPGKKKTTNYEFEPVSALDEKILENPAPFVAWVVKHWCFKTSFTKGGYCPENATLAGIRGGKYTLPLSYIQLADMFVSMPSINKGLNGIVSDEDLEAAAAACEVKEGARVNQTGEMTLADLGMMLGGITGTAAKNLSDAAQEKYAKLSIRTMKGGKEVTVGFNISDEDYEVKANKAVDILIGVFKEHILNAGTEDYSIPDVLDSLNATSMGYLTDKEVELVTDAEYVAMYLMMELIADGKEDEARAKMLSDLDEDDPIILTLQNINAKLHWPAAKRGRPPGSLNKPKQVVVLDDLLKSA